MYPPNMKSTRLVFVIIAVIGLAVSSCQRTGTQDTRTLTLAINSGVEGDALKQAAKDYEQQTGIHINIAEFPYANLFEKELIDLTARTGAYDLIMLDDPWFPKFASLNVLTDLTPLLQKRGKSGPDDDFVATSIALGREPYQTGALYALPYVGNSQLFFYRKDLFQKHNLKEPAMLGRCPGGGENDQRKRNEWRARRREGLRLRDARRAGQRRGRGFHADFLGLWRRNVRRGRVNRR